MKPLEKVHGLLRILHIAFTVAVPVYAVIAEQVVRNRTEERDVTIFVAAFAVFGVAEVVTGFILRRALLGPARETLRRQASDPTAVERWQAGNLISLVMAETVAILGMTLRLVGGTLLEAVPFYVVAILLLLVWTPRLPD